MYFNDSYMEQWKTGVLIALGIHAAVVLLALFGPDLMTVQKKREEVYTVKLLAPVKETMKSRKSPAPRPAPELSKPKTAPPPKSMPKQTARKIKPPPPAKKIEKIKKIEKSAPKAVAVKKPEPKPIKPPVVQKSVHKQPVANKKAVSLKPDKPQKKTAKSAPKPVAKKPVHKPVKEPVKSVQTKKKPAKAPALSEEEKIKRRIAALKQRVKEKKEQEFLEERLKQLSQKVKEKDTKKSSAAGAAVSGTGIAKTINQVVQEYGKMVSSQIWRRWKLPTPLIDKKGLEAVIEIKIATDGTILSHRFEKTSGDMLFDQSAMRAVKEASPVQPLPPELRPGPLVMGIRFRPEGM